MKIETFHGAHILMHGGNLEIRVQERPDGHVDVDLIEHGGAKFRLGFRESWGTHYVFLDSLKTPAPQEGA